MQRVLSRSPKDKKPPFSLAALEIPERDKLEMRIKSRRRVSYSWKQAEQIAANLRSMDSLGAAVASQITRRIILFSSRIGFALQRTVSTEVQ